MATLGSLEVQSEARVSAWASVFNLSCSAIGAGVLSFPYAFQSVGAKLEQA
jgi:amino acid permease